LKKLTTAKAEGPPFQTNGGTNVTSMSTNLQRKFAKGCNYNMKLVIRGDRNTGKSALLARLQGKPFVEEYVATDEIQVASINWSYKNTEDIVKVEVWDVVDVAKKRVKIEGLKTSDFETAVSPGLDAEFLDVYQGTHGVIMLLDITKSWTFDYVRREAEKVPSHIPILVLANFTDQTHHRQVTQMQIAGFIENFSRPGTDATEIRWAECSLRNGFGLKFLHRFFNVPFLTLQRQSLLQQLEVNSRDMAATQEELDLYMETEEANYQLFADSKTASRRAAAEQAAPAPSTSIVAGQPSNMVEMRASAPIPDISYSNKLSSAPIPDISYSNKLSSASIPDISNSNKPYPSLTAAVAPTLPSPRHHQTDTVDSFVPEDKDFDNFLTEETREGTRSVDRSQQDGDSSDDEVGGNPMVARYEDSVDVETYAAVNGSSSAQVLDDSSDDGDEVKMKVKKPQDDLDDFFNCNDKTVESLNSAAFETL